MFDYLFFDLDGTLTDPALGITNSFKYSLKHFGMEIPSYETLCTFIGPPLPDTFKLHFGFSEEKAAEGSLWSAVFSFRTVPGYGAGLEIVGQDC